LEGAIIMADSALSANDLISIGETTGALDVVTDFAKAAGTALITTAGPSLLAGVTTAGTALTSGAGVAAASSALVGGAAAAGSTVATIAAGALGVALSGPVLAFGGIVGCAYLLKKVID
jgi:hypothetical protein